MSALAPSEGERLQWYLNRLRCMTPAEVGHRLLRALEAQAQDWRLAPRTAIPAATIPAAVPAWIGAPPDVDPAPYLEEATRIVEGKYDLFALQGIELGAPPRWNRDPKTGTDAPLAHGSRLDYRDARQVGDIKYLWELNRHLHLVRLAQACALGGDARFALALRRQVESWIAECPFPLGPSWSSALEAALRLINWAAAWQLIGGASAPLFAGAGGTAFRAQWLESVFQHARFVRANFSRYSSANNHLIGEAAGLLVAALTWPCWPQARAWRDEARSILEREALLQSSIDGVNREQATCYQRFVLELLQLALHVARANGIEFPARVLVRCEAMTAYLCSIMDAGGHVPMLGDSDDGEALRLAPGRERDPHRSVLAAGALLFRRPEFAAKARGPDEHARWLFGAAAGAAPHHRKEGPLPPPRKAFAEGGVYVLGCDFETAREIRLVADAGPLGYLAIAAHGHADALAFTLSVGGLEFLVDPGTYAYHTGKQWRDYFRGTSAHNTVRIDSTDQSQSGGNFMWLRKACAGCGHWSSDARIDVFAGWHDGYTRLEDPVLHRRRIALYKPARRVVIEDTLEMAAAHTVELFFHCSESCSVEPTQDGYAISRGATTLLLALPRAGGATWRLFRGSEAPILGWVSRRFDRKLPSTTIAWQARLAGPVALQTEILC